MIRVEVDGFLIEGTARTRNALQTLREGYAEPFTARLFAELVRPGMVVLDIGAFLGRYSLLAARQTGRQGRVYAFEPDPQNFPLLVRNIAINGLSDRVAALPYAVADEKSVKTLFLDPQEGSGSSLVRSRRGAAEVVVINERFKRLFPITSRSKPGWYWYFNFLLYFNLWVNLLCVRGTDHPYLSKYFRRRT